MLSEKPLARNAVEGQQMVDAARKAGRVLDVAFNHRRRGDIQALKEVIDAGTLGRPYYAKASCSVARGFRCWAAGSPILSSPVVVRWLTSASTCWTTRCTSWASPRYCPSRRRPTPNSVRAPRRQRPLHSFELES